jgi:threonine/homoserine/homoserine lactone efflux protein
MISVIGEILPLAIGVAISPIPIIAAILMLLSPKAKSMSVAFLLGWIAGILVAIVAFTVLSSLLPQDEADGPSVLAGVIKIVLGVLLLLAAVRQWRGRPADGEQATLPNWMSAIDSMTPAKGFVLGFLLASVNPKNLLLAASAGLFVGSAQLTFGEAAVVVLIFTVLAGCTVLIPVTAYLIASARMREPLERLREWLVGNNATIMAVVLLMIAALMIGKGLGSF